MKDFLRACLFELFYLGFAFIGVAVLSLGISSGSLMMFFVGLTVAGVSIFERLSIKKEDHVPNIFVSFEKMLTELKEKKAKKLENVAVSTKNVETEKNFSEQIVDAKVEQGRQSGKYGKKADLNSNDKTETKTDAKADAKADAKSENKSKEEGKGK